MKKNNTISLIISLIISSVNVNAQEYSGGEGTQTRPFLISTKKDLIYFLSEELDLNKNFQQTVDIIFKAEDYNENNYNEQGYDSRIDDNSKFNGTYDGNNHIIENLKINGEQYTGFIGYIAEDGVVKNLTLLNAQIEATDFYTGGIVGHNKGKIENCHFSGNIISQSGVVGGITAYNSGVVSKCSSKGTIKAKVYIGGIVGKNLNSIEACYSNANITGLNLENIESENSYLGGLVGFNEGGSIVQSYATGAIIGSTRIGGLIGYLDKGIVKNCYAHGNVEGQNTVGGFCGYTSSDSIINCYSIGKVTAIQYFGGFIGLNNGCLVNDSFWDEQTSGDVYQWRGYISKKTIEMKNIIIYSTSGWHISNKKDNSIWIINSKLNNGYPYLIGIGTF